MRRADATLWWLLAALRFVDERRTSEELSMSRAVVMTGTTQAGPHIWKRRWGPGKRRPFFDSLRDRLYESTVLFSAALLR